jgi:hypothetical protein
VGPGKLTDADSWMLTILIVMTDDDTSWMTLYLCAD